MASSLDSRILELSRQLRLGTRVVDLYPSIEFSTPDKFLADLLQKICDGRAEERKLRNRKGGGFSDDKTLANVDNSDLELPSTITWEYITSCQFITDKKNLCLYGNPGTGKTHLATALGVAACELGYKPVFYTVTSLIEELTTAFNAQNHNVFIKRLAHNNDVIILDEMGYIPLPRLGTELLFQFVSACEKRVPLIITSNYPYSEWNRVLGNERLANAVIDRLVGSCFCIKHGGESRRLANALKLNGLA